MRFLIEQAIQYLRKNGYEAIPLNEMAFDRAEIQYEFKHQFFQIFENWCLCKYVSITSDKLELYNHWSHELETAILNVSTMQIKNAKRNTVFKAISEMYYEKAEFDKMDLTPKLKRKFEVEGISCDIASYINRFRKEMPYILKLIAYSSSEEIIEYCANV